MHTGSQASADGVEGTRRVDGSGINYQTRFNDGGGIYDQTRS